MVVEYDKLMISNFEQALLELYHGATEAFFDYYITEEDKAVFSSIHINHSPFTPEHIATSSYKSLNSDLTATLQEVGNSEDLSQNVAMTILKVLDPIFKSYWTNSLYIGASSANDPTSSIFWHTDAGNENNYRVILTFKGRPTLFCTNYNNITRNCENQDVHTPKQYQGVIFTHNKSVHSPPHLDEERLLIMFTVEKQPSNIINNDDL